MNIQISKVHTSFKLLFIVFFFLSIQSCNTALYYDHYSYKESISVKIEALALIKKSTAEFNKYEAKAEKIQIEMMKLYEYEKYRKNNDETVKMWKLMLDPDGGLYAGYIEKWKEKGKMSKVFATEAKKNIEQAFDIIIGFENKKIKGK
ncbi:MAG: hypothetical protein CL663_03345 [Bacteroidetes bacterium]|nr:hypothetical protein [Bacteroidota bacterium]|tara:strand:- start:375 stop:818 length:444 start_codon:yes stop_codon:yes gene_type:complete